MEGSSRFELLSPGPEPSMIDRLQYDPMELPNSFELLYPASKAGIVDRLDYGSISIYLNIYYFKVLYIHCDYCAL